MNTTGLYPGSFDPVTYGHVDVIERGLEIFDRLIVAVADNSVKTHLFTTEERIAMLREVTAHLQGVEVTDFGGLTVDYAASRGVAAIIRGLRAVSDFEFEFTMALTNRKLNPKIETVFLMPSESYSFLSSSLIKQIAAFGGNISAFVPPIVAERLRQKYARK